MGEVIQISKFDYEKSLEEASRRGALLALEQAGVISPEYLTFAEFRRRLAKGKRYGGGEISQVSKARAAAILEKYQVPVSNQIPVSVLRQIGL